MIIFSRYVLVIASFFANAALAQSDQSFRLGQIVPLTGPLANVGKEIRAASQAAIDQHNNSNPRAMIELLVEDDENNADKSAAHVAKLSDKVNGLLSCFGTVSCLSQQKAIRSLGLPLIGPIAGAPQLRGADAGNVFAIRGSAKDELDRIVQLCEVMNLKSISVVIQDDGFGQAYWTAAQVAMQAKGIKVHNTVFIKPQSPNYGEALSVMIADNGSALLLLANASHSLGVLKAWRDKEALPFVLNLAGQANGFFAKGLTGLTTTAAFVTVTPSPWESRLGLQRDYQQAMKQAGITQLSYLSFEAFINARIAIEGIKQSRRNSAVDLISTISRNTFDLGGFEIAFGNKELKRYTDLSLLRTDGTFKH